MFNTFRSYPGYHSKNIEGSRTTYAKSGIFETPEGPEEPAVVIFRDKFCLGILTADDATRLSNEIIDAVERPAV